MLRDSVKRYCRLKDMSSGGAEEVLRCEALWIAPCHLQVSVTRSRPWRKRERSFSRRGCHDTHSRGTAGACLLQLPKKKTLVQEKNGENLRLAANKILEWSLNVRSSWCFVFQCFTAQDVLRDELGSASRSLEAQLQHGAELKNELAKRGAQTSSDELRPFHQLSRSWGHGETSNWSELISSKVRSGKNFPRL